MPNELEPQDRESDSWTRRQFLRNTAILGAGLAASSLFSACGFLFPEPTSPATPLESAKKKENLVTSAEVW